MSQRMSLATLGLATPLLIALLTATPAAAETLRTVASFTVLADIVQQVGGAHVTVRSLVGPNGDPHEFEPSPDDARALKAADLTFVSGLGLEGWMDRLIVASGYQGKPVTVSDGIVTRSMQEDGETVTDPHVWNSPANVRVWVDNIEQALAKADPADAADFKANAARYKQTLTELDQYAHAKFDGVEAGKRKVLTSHDAFGYFARDYGITFLSPLGLSTETEASAGDVAALIEQIRSAHVASYFIENSNDPRLIVQIAAATGAEPGGELYVESLSDEKGPAPSYAAMFRYNVDQIAAAIAKSS